MFAASQFFRIQRIKLPRSIKDIAALLKSDCSRKVTRDLYSVFILIAFSSVAEVSCALAIIPFFKAFTSLSADHVQRPTYNLNAVPPLHFFFSPFSIILCFLLLLLLSAFLRVASTKASAFVSASLTNSAATSLFTNIVSSNIKVIEDISIAELQAYFSTYLDQLSVVINGILVFISSILTTFLLVLTLFYIDFWVTVSLLTAFSAIYFVYLSYSRFSLNINSKLISLSAINTSKIVNMFKGAYKEIFFTSSFPEICKSFSEHDAKLRNATASAYSIVAIARPIIENSGLIVIIIVSLVVLSASTNPSQLFPRLASLIFATQKIIPLLQSAFSAWGQFTANKYSIQSLATIKYKALASQYPKLSQVCPSINPGQRFSIILDSISFSYDSEKNSIFYDSTIDIVSPCSYALIGASGSGKSTFVEVVCGLRPPTKGRLLFNSVILAEDGCFKNNSELGRYQASIKYVTQQPYVYNSTLLYNLTRSVDYTSVDTNLLCQLIASFCLDDLVQSRGLHSNINDGLSSLSGGQVQRIALVRALYQKPSLLILDEVTSGLDQATESIVIKSLASFTKNISVIMISHKYSSLLHCDYTLQIKDKRVLKFMQKQLAS